MDKRLLIVIAGPTASGKSELAVEIAEHYQTEILSADSRQCYRELNIGTAKPTVDLLRRAPHHFINSHSIEVPIHAGEFASEGRRILDRIFSTKQVAVVAGGTGLYIEALTKGIDPFPTIEPGIRDRASSLVFENGVEEACRFLAVQDPDYLNSVDRSNPARLRRAIEVILQTGLPYSSFLNKGKSNLELNILMFVPEIERSVLYDRINQRVDRMINDGLIEEVKGLLPFRHYQTLQTVGYSEVFQHLQGKIDQQTAIELIKQHTRNYAKRQLTWFRNKGDFRFIPYADAKSIVLDQARCLFTNR
jgi:tRNA dimethylallyltransferase